MNRDDNLLGYAIWRAGTSVGKNQHFLRGVGDPVHWLLRVLQMMAAIVMVWLPVLYYFVWKDTALLWIAGAAFVAVLLIAYLERKWVQWVHKNNPKVWSGMS